SRRFQRRVFGKLAGRIARRDDLTTNRLRYVGAEAIRDGIRGTADEHAWSRQAVVHADPHELTGAIERVQRLDVQIHEHTIIAHSEPSVLPTVGAPAREATHLARRAPPRRDARQMVGAPRRAPRERRTRRAQWHARWRSGRS